MKTCPKDQMLHREDADDSDSTHKPSLWVVFELLAAACLRVPTKEGYGSNLRRISKRILCNTRLTALALMGLCLNGEWPAICSLEGFLPPKDRQTLPLH